MGTDFSSTHQKTELLNKTTSEPTEQERCDSHSLLKNLKKNYFVTNYLKNRIKFKLKLENRIKIN